MSAHVVDIHIFGKSLKVNCPEEEIASLNEAAGDLELRLHKLRQKSQSFTSEQLILLAALNISYELKLERAKSGEVDREITEKTLQIQKQLEQKLSELSLCIKR